MLRAPIVPAAISDSRSRLAAEIAGRKALRRESTVGGLLSAVWHGRRGGEKIQSDEGNTGAIFGFLVRVGLVDTMWCGGDSSFLSKSKRKPGGRVSESFRGMLAICGGGGGGGGGVWWG